jgi:hypothetical protein
MPALGAVDAGFQDQLVARLHRPLEARAVDADEVHHRVVVRLLPIDSKDSSAAACASASSISTPGITGRCRKVTGEEGLVDGDVLQRLDALVLLELEHAVDQQDRIAVRQLLEDLCGCRASGSWSLLLQRAHALAQACSCRSVAAFFSQDALSSKGNTPLYWPGLADRARDHGGRRDVHMVGQLQVAQDDGAAAGVQWRPMRALPATPTQPAMALCAPMCTLWPIWIRLSSLTPSSMHGVVERAPVDAGVGADLDVVADAHAPELLDLLPAALVGAKPKPSAPITAPLCTMPRAPIAAARPA